MKIQNWIWALATSPLFFACQNNGENSRSINQHADSLSYTIISKHQSFQNCNPETNPCTHVQIKYPQFSNLEKPLSDSLQIYLNRFWKWSETGPGQPDSLLKEFIKEYEVVSIENKSPLPWYLDKEIKVTTQRSNWISLEFSESGFSGGAHDFSITNFIILEKETGKRLRINNFFDSTGIKKLTRLGEKYFRISRELTDQALEDEGYWFENNAFSLPDNFCFTSVGLLFLFNEYEVGPYSMGQMRFEIPAPEFVKLMKVK